MRVFKRLFCEQELSLILKSAIGPDQFAYKKGHNTTVWPSSNANIFGLNNLKGIRIFSEPFHLMLVRLLTQSPIAFCAKR